MEVKSSLFIASVSSFFSMGSCTWYDDLFVPVTTSLTRVVEGEWESSSSRVDSLYGLLTLMAIGSIPAFSGALVSFFSFHILLIDHPRPWTKRKIRIIKEGKFGGDGELVSFPPSFSGVISWSSRPESSFQNTTTVHSRGSNVVLKVELGNRTNPHAKLS